MKETIFAHWTTSLAVPWIPNVPVAAGVTADFVAANMNNRRLCVPEIPAPLIATENLFGPPGFPSGHGRSEYPVQADHIGQTQIDTLPCKRMDGMGSVTNQGYA